jgi:hypothetical protein
MKVTRGHLLGRQEWGDHMRVANGDAGSQEGVIVTFRIAYMYKLIILDITRFKAVLAMNLS